MNRIRSIYVYISGINRHVPGWVAFVLLLIGITLDSILGVNDGPLQFIYAFFAFAGLVCLSGSYVIFHYSKREDFDIIAGSETIVAYGIITLVLGIVSASIAIAPAIQSIASSQLLPPDALGAFGVRLIESLVFAGLCPFIAVMLRQLGLNANMESVGSILSIDPTTLANNIEALSEALSEHGKMIEKHLASLALAADNGARKLNSASSSIDLASSSVNTSMESLTRHSKQFSKSVELSGEKAVIFADTLASLDGEARKAQDLMAGLSELIAQVEKFTKGTKK